MAIIDLEMLDTYDILSDNLSEAVGKILSDKKRIIKCSFCGKISYIKRKAGWTHPGWVG